MTTKPKARRFRLRLGDDANEALRTTVAPQRAQVTGQPSGQPAGASTARPSPESALAAEAERAARRAAAAQPVERAPTAAQPSATPRPDTNSLFDEDDTPKSVTPRPAQAATKPATPPNAEAKTARPAPTEHAADVSGSARAEAEIEAIRAEELTGRQLRMAMRVAQRNGIKATSGIEAVRMLRARGIDPFEASTLLDIVRDQNKASDSRALTTTEQPQLPKAYREAQPPATTDPVKAAEGKRKAEISRIQVDIAKRRRRRMALLGTRLMVFVGLPTLITAWYFYMIATPLYATNSEFVIQQADAQGGGGGLAGMLGGASPIGGLTENGTVQSYLQSRDAMRRLDEEFGFKAYFQQAEIDPLRRLPQDATNEAAYRLYQDMVQVGYDPTEGFVHLEVLAADPETSETFARALVRYAEEQVDQMTQRLRENQMTDATESVEMAEVQMNAAQLRVLELQERYQILSSEVEVTLLTQQITSLETMLNQERLSLDDILANARPNQARLAQVERRINSLETQIGALRAALTQGGADGTSLARIQRELVMAESDVATRQMLLAQAMQTMEASRIEANRQVRYLSLGVSPVAPDEATYPRAFENTALAFLIFSGIYLMISMTAAILREQVTG